MTKESPTDILRKAGRGLMDTLGKFPVETALGLTFFTILVLQETIDKNFPSVDPFIAMLWIVPTVLLSFCLGRLARRKPLLRWAYYLSYFICIPLVAFLSPDAEWVGVSYILAVLLVFLGDRPLEDKDFAQSFIHTLARTFVGLTLGLILMLAVWAIIASVNFLFALDLDDPFISNPLGFVALVVTPLLWCRSMDSKASEDKKGKWDKFLRILIDYILSPAIIIYTLILYAYCIRILVMWTLPEGGVAYMVTTFMLLSLLTLMLRETLPEKRYGWFWDNFSLIGTGPLILLWVGTIRRISDYGLTPSRFHLLLLSFVLTLSVVLLLPKGRIRRYQLMCLTGAAACIIFSYIPGISAEDISLLNQRSRLRSACEELSLYGITASNPTLDVVGPEDKDAVLPLVKKANDAYYYIKHNSSPDSPVLGQYSFVPPLSGEGALPDMLPAD